MNLTPPVLWTITARTLIVHGDRDPLYPVPLALEMYAAAPNGGDVPIFGELRVPFVGAVSRFPAGESTAGSAW